MPSGSVRNLVHNNTALIFPPGAVQKSDERPNPTPPLAMMLAKTVGPKPPPRRHNTELPHRRFPTDLPYIPQGKSPLQPPSRKSSHFLQSASCSPTALATRRSLFIASGRRRYTKQRAGLALHTCVETRPYSGDHQSRSLQLTSAAQGSGLYAAARLPVRCDGKMRKTRVQAFRSAVHQQIPTRPRTGIKKGLTTAAPTQAPDKSRA